MACAIVVEGPDNGGKTTLVKKLASMLGLPVVVSVFDSRSNYDKRIAGVHEQWLRMASGNSFVADRSPIISEQVYGPLLRKSNDIYDVTGVPFMDQLELLRRLNPLVIYCRPPENVMFEFGDREQMPGVIENAKSLVQAYDVIMRTGLKIGKLNVVEYDYTDPDSWANLESTLQERFIMEEVLG